MLLIILFIYIIFSPKNNNDNNNNNLSIFKLINLPIYVIISYPCVDKRVEIL